jgi:electron transport complex protein RnfE
VGNQLKNGIFKQNPVFVLLLGMCPALAVTTSVWNGLGMGLCATFVLILSNTAISALRSIIPDNVRIVVNIVIIATFVTVTDLLLQAYFPALSSSLGIYIPLIVVNCIVLERAELFARKNTVLLSAIDGLSMGLGFTAALIAMSAVRETLGAGTFLGRDIFPGDFQPALLVALAPGGFLTLACLIAVTQWFSARRNAR